VHCLTKIWFSAAFDTPLKKGVSKAQKSRRSVMIAPFAHAALKKHRVSQLEDKLKAGEF
jgi:hypothetical protein